MALELEFQRALAALKAMPHVQKKIAKRRARGESIPTIYISEEDVKSGKVKSRIRKALSGMLGVRSSSRKKAGKKKSAPSKRGRRRVKRAL